MGRRIRIWLFPVIGLILMTAIIISNGPLLKPDSGSVIHVWLDSFISGRAVGPGEIGSVSGDLPDFELKPGDILLGGFPNCSYGLYTHIALYAGEDQIIEAFMDVGVIKQNYRHFRNYTYMAVLRPQLPEDVKLAAVEYAESKVGEVFFPLCFKQDEHYWNCSKIVWKAFAEQGVDLDPIGDLWIAPDAFKLVPQMEVLYER